MLCGGLVATVLGYPAVGQSLGSGDGGAEQALLKRTAEAYRETLDYELVVETNVVSEPGSDGPTKYRYRLAASPPHNFFTDEKVLSPISYRVQLGTDGNTVWAYSPSAGKYIQDGGDDLLAELSEQHRRLFRRFENLDRIALSVKIEKADEVLREDGRVHCVRLLIQPRTGDMWDERLWIEKDRHLVRKSIFRERTPFEARITTTRWRTLRINTGTDVDFSSKRPRHADRTNQLQVP